MDIPGFFVALFVSFLPMPVDSHLFWSFVGRLDVMPSYPMNKEDDIKNHII